jgi:hypothetical protein
LVDGRRPWCHLFLERSSDTLSHPHHASELDNVKNVHARVEEEDKLQMVKPSVQV